MPLDIQSDIIKALGLDELPEETQGELVQKMTESVMKRVMLEVFEKLPDEATEEFFSLQEKGDGEALEAFIKSKVPDYENVVRDTVRSFVEEIRGTVATLKESFNQSQ